MSHRNPEKPKKGDVIRAKLMNLLMEMIQSGYLVVCAPLSLVRSGRGYMLRADFPQYTTARITAVGSGGKYAWQEVLETGSGWVDGALNGTLSVNTLVEINGYATLPVGRRVRIYKSRYSTNWLCQKGSCS